LIEKRVAIRWSNAAKIPMRSWRLSVGWPTRIPASGERAELVLHPRSSERTDLELDPPPSRR
jgi:hypothetical protein